MLKCKTYLQEFPLGKVYKELIERAYKALDFHDVEKITRHVYIRLRTTSPFIIDFKYISQDTNYKVTFTFTNNKIDLDFENICCNFVEYCIYNSEIVDVEKYYVHEISSYHSNVLYECMQQLYNHLENLK
jgi:hypothetical protein